MVSLVNGNYVCSSSSATRVAVNPQIPKAVHLVTHFGGSRNPVAELPVEFATAEAAAADAANRARTIAELLDLHNAGASVESKYCCGGIVSSVESRTPWYYTACNMCLRKCFTWRGAGYWCPEHWEISEEHIRVGYKIQLTLRDMTGEAPFIIFGSCGNVLTHTTAQILAQRYPHRPGQLPPELGTLIGQYFKFEVKLPMVPVGGSSSGEYRMLRVFPNDNLEAQLPPPMMHALPPIVPAPPQVAAVVPAQSSHRPQVVQPSNQVTLNVSPGGMQLSPAGTYGASSSSSAKGKEKISSPVFQNVNPVFCIGQPVSEMPGQVIDQALPANPPSDNPDISHGNAAPVSQGLTLPLDQMVCSSYPENLQGVLKADATVVAEPLASASGPVVSANVPATSDLVVNEGPNMSIPSLAITSNDPPSTLAGSDVVSQSSSPMTKLLASPLA
ncbi:unnamed protein product [Linum trigynum]|uniref:Uncharacterized protein n=1 Tax=Linum trigynum TaxID=586398 RepID=A0AAV2CFX4_9ROSI